MVFTQLNYIQTPKIQIFFLRNVGHAFLLHLHISKKALELRVTQQTWQYPKFRMPQLRKLVIIEKNKKEQKVESL